MAGVGFYHFCGIVAGVGSEEDEAKDGNDIRTAVAGGDDRRCWSRAEFGFIQER